LGRVKKNKPTSISGSELPEVFAKTDFERSQYIQKLRFSLLLRRNI